MKGKDTAVSIPIQRGVGRGVRVARYSMRLQFNRSGYPIKRCCGRGALIVLAVVGCVALEVGAWAQSLPWSQRVATAVIEHGDAKTDGLGILLNGMDAAWYESANGDYFHYTQRVVDRVIAADGSIVHDKSAGVETSDIALGRQLLMVYRVTQNAKYYAAASALRRQLEAPHRGGSMEDLYLTEPFYAEYSSLFGEPESFRDITRRLVSAEKEAHQLRAGASNEMGWYMMALVDSLDFYPADDTGRASVLKMLGRAAHTAAGRPATSNAETCMIVYALQKAVRMGYLPARYAQNARRAWQRVASDATVQDAGEYPLAAGAFMLAATEMEMAEQAVQARSKTVVVDAWFNSQQRKNAAGQDVSFHYKWGDYSDSGFSLLGHMFASHGVKLATLREAPTSALLKQADYYIIASPDIPVKNPHPHYADRKDADEIAAWVKEGGVLILMPNDPANGDIEHLDLIADRFGIHFNQTLAHHVVGDEFKPGLIPVAGGGEVFRDAHTIYMKDTCTISLSAGARALLSDDAGAVIAAGKYGKGTVVAVVDPWLYNEYTDHRKVLPEQDNYVAGREFVAWVLRQSHRAAAPQHGLKEQAK